VDDSPEASVQQPDSCKLVLHVCFYFSYPDTHKWQVLVITMVLSFAIDDHIEGGVIAAVIMLNIVVG
jgi:hypothetical protein